MTTNRKQFGAREVGFILAALRSAFSFSRSSSVSGDLDWDAILVYAKQNNILYHVAKHLPEAGCPPEKFEPVLEAGKRMIESMGNALQFLNDNFSQRFILIKTFRMYDRIPNDLDVLVADFEGGRRELQKLLGDEHGYERKTREVGFYNPENVKVHLHGRVAWLDRDYMDPELLFSRTRKEIFCGTPVEIPDYDMDYLIHLAHMNYEPMHFTLSELAYLHAIAPFIDRDFVYAQARKHHWNWALQRTERVLADFDEFYFGAPEPLEVFPLDRVMPKTFPRSHIIKAFLEKGVVVEPLKKFPKAIKVLLSGNSYDGYYTAPESRIVDKD